MVQSKLQICIPCINHAGFPMNIYDCIVDCISEKPCSLWFEKVIWKEWTNDKK
jgi:hypothetical protein